jgi:hypothetical protein
VRRINQDDIVEIEGTFYAPADRRIFAHIRMAGSRRRAQDVRNVTASYAPVMHRIGMPFARLRNVARASSTRISAFRHGLEFRQPRDCSAETVRIECRAGESEMMEPKQCAVAPGAQRQYNDRQSNCGRAARAAVATSTPCRRYTPPRSGYGDQVRRYRRDCIRLISALYRALDKYIDKYFARS